jgi:hypothetical protein
MLEQFENGRPVALITFEGMGSYYSSLFLVKMRHDVDSTSSRYTAHPLTASVSDFVGPTDRLSMAV